MHQEPERRQRIDASRSRVACRRSRRDGAEHGLAGRRDGPPRGAKPGGKPKGKPKGKPRRDIPRGRRMSWDLYRSIVDQSIEMGIRRYSVYLMNEPMLDRELAERVAYVSARIKKQMMM